MEKSKVLAKLKECCRLKHKMTMIKEFDEVYRSLLSFEASRD